VPNQDLCDEHGRQLSSHQLLGLLSGLPTPKRRNASIRIPEDFETHARIGNVHIIVCTRDEARRKVFGVNRRVIAVCPHCRPIAYVCAGHLHQHRAAHHPETSHSAWLAKKEAQS
jgi:hypothetical protein